MTLPLADLRTLAWHQFDCDTCAEPAGRRCITSSGARTVPHKPRLDAARGWDARQGEVDELQHARDQADALLTAANNELRAVTENAATLTEQLKTARIGAALVPGLQQQVADLLVKIALLENPPIPPAAERTLFGACPASPGGTSLAAQRAPFLKYGHPVTVRQFFGTEVAPRAKATEVLRLHASWNLGSMTRADLTADWVKKVTANLLPNDRVEVIHEADKKVTDGKRTYEACVAYKNKFFDLVTQVRPDLKVVNTLTGGALADYGKDAEERWGAVKAHLLGLDADGVHDTAAPLNIDYKDEVDSAVAFVKKYAAMGYEGIVAPEFGTSRPKYDTDGKIRAKWIDTNAGYMVAAGFLEVNAYEFESTPGNEFKSATPEFALYQALVATNPTKEN